MTFEDRTTQPTTKKPFYKRWWFIVPVAILIVVALFIAAMLWIADKQESRARDVALAQCKQKISHYSKYPGGISYPNEPVFNSFPGTQENNVGAQPGDYYVSIDGEVDLVNGFNTPVRHYFDCKAIVSNDGDLHSIDMDIDQNHLALNLRLLERVNQRNGE